MSNKYAKPMYEFIVWTNCTNNCRFCWQKKKGDEQKLLNHQEKKQSFAAVLDILNSGTIEPGSDLLLVGGEIFDDLVNFYNNLMSLVAKLADMLLSGNLRFLYINTNLIYRDLDDLSDFLSAFVMANVLERVKFTTSFDVFGRYVDMQTEKLVLDNLKILKHSYPQLNIVVNMIMTKQFCQKILNNELNIKEFCEKYKVGVNAIPFIVLGEEMRATKDEVYRTLLKIDQEIPGYFNSYVDNFTLEQEKRLFEYDKTKGYLPCTAKMNDCGHNVNFTKVFADNSCFICNLLELRSSVSGY